MPVDQTLQRLLWERIDTDLHLDDSVPGEHVTAAVIMEPGTSG
jgi:hypothetical protein